jgi:hypothetical protein|tara:strand:+ start:338 stop:544 length:207 start_codon:yes stop_codon:yes gene_type:complete
MGRVKELWQALKDAGKELADFDNKEEQLKEAIKLKDEQIDQELMEGDWDVDCDENGPFFVYTGDRHDA